MSESIWNEYSNSNMPGGTFLLDGISKDQCVDLCEGDMSCASVDYNAYNEGCWYHNTTRDCYHIKETADVTHIRRDPCP